MTRTKIFISSVQSEFASERSMLAEYIRKDALLGKFFEVFIFEEMPAANQSPSNVYLSEVAQCDIYLGLFGNKYGWEDSEGVSPTEREYDCASENHKTRLIFISSNSSARHAKEYALIAKAERDIVRRNFDSHETLRIAVYSSLVRYLEEDGIIRWIPFDAATDNGAGIEDLDEDKIKDFLRVAHSYRGFPMDETTSVETLLKHLDLIDRNGKISNAAILLFGKKPQRFFITSEVKCMQFYGNKVEKPVPSYQIYKGDLFQLVDQATSFVMSRVDNWVGTRDSGKSASVPTRTELPYDAVREAIVNAICHRDYASKASVQVMLFRDRLEVWNPGKLPFGLSINDLYAPHKSLPANPLIAESMYLYKYIEKAGTGTEDIVGKCEAYGLKKPEFIQETDFRVVIWRADKKEDSSSTLNGQLETNLRQEPEKDNSNPHTNNELTWRELETNLGQDLKILRSIISICVEAQPSSLLIKIANEKNKTRFMSNFINPLLKMGILKMTIPDKPTSSKQKYITTEVGRMLLYAE
ncbi:MAG: DUF4062 domain-containing protein [Muribaculaceae bacterium]|nr:DUF4062 domain-containing protein [Muribaculaceae bacterium]